MRFVENCVGRIMKTCFKSFFQFLSGIFICFVVITPLKIFNAPFAPYVRMCHSLVSFHAYLCVFCVRMHASFLSHHLNSLMRELRRMSVCNQCVRGAAKYAPRATFSHLHLDSVINNYHNPRRHVTRSQHAADSTKECHHSTQQQCGTMCNLAEALGIQPETIYDKQYSKKSNIG